MTPGLQGLYLGRKVQTEPKAAVIRRAGASRNYNIIKYTMIKHSKIYKYIFKIILGNVFHLTTSLPALGLNIRAI